jgi:hypothetical protein
MFGERADREGRVFREVIGHERDAWPCWSLVPAHAGRG